MGGDLEVGRGATSGAEVHSTDYELLTFRDGITVLLFVWGKQL